MIKKFCPRCGTELIDNTCPSCNPPTDKLVIPDILIQISEFNRVWDQGVWKNFEDLEDEMIRIIHRLVGDDVEVEFEPFEFTPKPKEKIKINTKFTKDNQPIEKEITLGYMQCDFGQKQKTEYFEGILQLRNSRNDMLDFVVTEMNKVAVKGVFITKTIEHKSGVDLYFTKKTYLSIMGQKLINEFGGKMSMHPQLFSRNHLTSKDIYRLNVLVEFPEFTKGDVITFDLQKHPQKMFVHIKSMGKIVHGTNLITGKQIGFELKYADNIEVVPKQTTQIINTHPQIEVMDTDNYQMQPVANKEFFKEYKSQDTVDIVKTPQGVFIIE